MRTLQLAKFYPPVRGGIETTSYDLTNGLNEIGILTDVLCSHTEFKNLCETGKRDEKIFRAASLGTVLSTSISLSLIKKFKEIHHSYDIIHVHLPNPIANIALLLSMTKAKIVLHWHSDIIKQKNMLKIYEPIQRQMLNRADAIIATSQAYAESSPFLNQFRNKIQIIPSGIHCHDKLNQNKNNIFERLPRNKKIVFSLGRMTGYKGFENLIDACEYLDKDTLIVVAGGGDLLEYYKSKVIKKGFQNNIVFLGQISDEDVNVLFNNCDIFCLPSTTRAEAFGLVLVEAMAASRPIVTTNILGSGVPWVNTHEETGLNVTPNDPINLAEALHRLLGDNELRERMGRAGRNRYLSHFTAEQMIKKTAALYHNLVDNA